MLAPYFFLSPAVAPSLFSF